MPGVQPTVVSPADTEHLSGDEGRVIGGEEQHGCGHFLGPGKPTKRNRLDQSLFQAFGLRPEQRVSVGRGHTQFTVIV